MTRQTFPVPFYTPVGTVYVLDVAYIGDFARNAKGRCAFCDGDPCAESSLSTTVIAMHRHGLGKLFETCPCCKGAPT